MTSLRQALVPLAAVTLLSVLGCSTRDPSRSPAIASDPTVTASLSLDPVAVASPDCVDMTVEPGYGAATSIDQLRDLGVVALAGRYAGVGETHWNTPDGQRPTRDQVEATAARLFRPITFEGARLLVGIPDPATLSVRGGRLGCDVVTYADDEDLLAALVVGETYVAVFMPIDDSLEQPSGRLSIVSAWPVEPDGTVHTESDGDLPLDVVVKRLASRPAGS